VRDFDAGVAPLASVSVRELGWGPTKTGSNPVQQHHGRAAASRLPGTSTRVCQQALRPVRGVVGPGARRAKTRRPSTTCVCGADTRPIRGMLAKDWTASARSASSFPQRKKASAPTEALFDFNPPIAREEDYDP
jgi:hypothetical protein